MDRPTVYSGALPRSVDFLRLGQSAMVGLAKLSEAVLGTGAVVDGFTLVPTQPASLGATLSGGSIYEQENLEATAWSGLPADNTHIIVKQGIQLDPTTLTFAPPGTAGYAQCFLIEASYVDSDTGPIVLPYYNAATPAVPYSGPGNAGSANNTIRAGAIALQVKAGIAALAGTQIAPAPDPGFVGLYVVTLSAGATAVTAGNISAYPGAPFLAAKLGQLPAYIQNDTPVGVTDTGTAANALVVSPTPAFAAYLPFQRLRVKMTRVFTGPGVINVSGLGNVPIVKGGGAALGGGEWAVGDYVSLVGTGTAFQVGSQLSLSQVLAALTGAEGIQVNNTTGVLSLNVPGLTEEDSLANVDLFPFYSVGDAHHRKTTLSNIATTLGGSTALTNVFVTRAPNAAAVSVTYGMTGNQLVSSNTNTQVALAGSNTAFCAISGGSITITSTGIYLLSGTLLGNTNQPSGQLQYSSLLILKNNSLLTQTTISNYSFGSVLVALNVTDGAYLANGDVITLVFYTHSQSNNDTGDSITASGTSFTLVKVG